MPSRMVQLFSQLPEDVEAAIFRSPGREFTVKELGLMRLVNKTWKRAVEGGQLGPLGRFLRPGLPRLAILVRKHPSECWYTCLKPQTNRFSTECRSDSKAYVAIGILDEEAGSIHIVLHDVPGISTLAPLNPCVLLHGTSMVCFSKGSSRSSTAFEHKLSSIDLCSPGLGWQERGSLYPSECAAPFNYLRVYNGAAMDERSWVLFGTAVNSRGWSGHRVLINDTLRDTWRDLPPLHSNWHRPSTNFCFVSQGKNLAGSRR